MTPFILEKQLELDNQLHLFLAEKRKLKVVCVLGTAGPDLVNKK